MNLNSKQYNQFRLCREMMETPYIIKEMPGDIIGPIVKLMEKSNGLFITGEGSSRIFPAKNMMYENLLVGKPVNIMTEGATQTLEYKLDNTSVIGLSNSGKTKELLRLFQELQKNDHGSLIGITANDNSALEKASTGTIVLECGQEKAVAATKSIVEQALVLEQIYNALVKRKNKNLPELAGLFNEVLEMKIDPEIPATLSQAKILYFAGRNNGVAEELTLKTNEITRKKSDFLEGTYCVHGIEEVMDKNEALILIDPFIEEEDKFYEVLVKDIGMNVIAIAPRQTRFNTIIIPDKTEYRTYLQLAAGWNVLVEIGIQLGINLDKTERARKIGNEYIENKPI